MIVGIYGHCGEKSNNMSERKCTISVHKAEVTENYWMDKLAELNLPRDTRLITGTFILKSCLPVERKPIQ